MKKYDIEKLNEAVEKAFNRIFEEEEKKEDKKDNKKTQWHDEYVNNYKNDVVQTRMNPNSGKEEYKIPTRDTIFKTKDAAISALDKNNKNTESKIKDIVSEAVKMVLNEGRSRFINVELPQDLADDEEVMGVIRNAMREIGYEYYNNECHGYDRGTCVYHYCPYRPPIELSMSDVDDSFKN